MNSLLLTDGYKTGHHIQYPEGTQYVYSNLTPRSAKHAPKGVKEITWFGLQYALKYIDEHFDKNFFSKERSEVIPIIKEQLTAYLGYEYDTSHFEALHDLGHLPIKVKSLLEGHRVPIGVPVMTIVNTLPEFYWVTNYLETILSTLLWQPTTSATIAYEYRRILEKYALETDPENLGLVPYQAHDFSMRGMSSVESSIASGLGHALYFRGSDSLPVIWGAKYYYLSENVINSVNATEHSVMSAGSKEGELVTFRRLIEKYPSGILSVVSDTWDLWKVLTEYLPELKDDILSRDGKLVVRPDSGDPVRIICGFEKHEMKSKHWTENNPDNYCINKGVIELLWDIFGGTINEQGYKVLDPHIGAIYGDSITITRCREICQRLKGKGFASTNIVFGVGSYTYQYNTRDTFGFAVKATSVVINGERQDIFKDPVTSDGMKKSAKGLLKVMEIDGKYELMDQVSEIQEEEGELQIVYKDGEFLWTESLEDIRKEAVIML